jgi:hypothetical protein
MDGGRYILREDRRRNLAWIALAGAGLAVLVTGPMWAFVAAGSTGLDRRTAIVLTVIVIGVILLICALLAGLDRFDRDLDAAGTSLIIDKRGVYLGGRPGRRLDWNAITAVTVFIDSDHREAGPGFWTGGWPAGECCIEFRPRADPDGGAHGRHRVARGLRREFANAATIVEVREALLRYAPKRALGRKGAPAEVRAGRPPGSRGRRGPRRR